MGCTSTRQQSALSKLITLAATDVEDVTLLCMIDPQPKAVAVTAFRTMLECRVPCSYEQYSWTTFPTKGGGGLIFDNM